MMVVRQSNPLRILVVSLFLCLLPAGAAWAGGQPAPPLKALLDSGRADEALRQLTPLATGNNAEAYNALGRVYFALGDWDNAMRNCERAVQLQPNNAQYQLWFGRALGEKADNSGALTAYQLARRTVAAFVTAHSLDPEDMPIARDLGEFYAAAPVIVGGGIAKAMELAASLDRRHPSDAAWLRAEAAANDHDWAQADAQFRASIANAPQAAAPRLDYARFLRGRKRLAECQKLVTEALASRIVHPNDLYDAAELLLAAEMQLPTAAAKMRAYIGGEHLEPAPLFRAHFLLGEILLKSGDRAHAIEEYRSALALASSFQPAQAALARLGMR